MFGRKRRKMLRRIDFLEESLRIQSDRISELHTKVVSLVDYAVACARDFREVEPTGRRRSTVFEFCITPKPSITFWLHESDLSDHERKLLNDYRPLTGKEAT